MQQRRLKESRQHCCFALCVSAEETSSAKGHRSLARRRSAWAKSASEIARMAEPAKLRCKRIANVLQAHGDRCQAGSARKALSPGNAVSVSVTWAPPVELARKGLAQATPSKSRFKFEFGFVGRGSGHFRLYKLKLGLEACAREHKFGLSL